MTLSEDPRVDLAQRKADVLQSLVADDTLLPWLAGTAQRLVGDHLFGRLSPSDGDRVADALAELFTEFRGKPLDLAHPVDRLVLGELHVWALHWVLRDQDDYPAASNSLDAPSAYVLAGHLVEASRDPADWARFTDAVRSGRLGAQFVVQTCLLQSDAFNFVLLTYLAREIESRARSGDYRSPRAESFVVDPVPFRALTPASAREALGSATP